jgi:hypothetical protein
METLNPISEFCIDISEQKDSAYLFGSNDLRPVDAPMQVFKDVINGRIRLYDRDENGVLFPVRLGNRNMSFSGKEQNNETAAVFLFASANFTEGGNDDEGWYYDFVLNLNTDELISKFATATVRFVHCYVDVVLTGLVSGRLTRRFRMSIKRSGYNGNETAPVNATVPLPVAPQANSVLMGSGDGLSWVFTTLSQLWANLVAIVTPLQVRNDIGAASQAALDDEEQARADADIALGEAVQAVSDDLETKQPLNANLTAYAGAANAAGRRSLISALGYQTETGSFTGIVGTRHTLNGTGTATDPTTKIVNGASVAVAAGDFYEAVVGSGTLTIGAATFSTAGTVVTRSYDGGAWSSRVFYAPATYATASALVSDSGISATPTGKVVSLLGLAASGDGGGGSFQIRAANGLDVYDQRDVFLLADGRVAERVERLQRFTDSQQSIFGREYLGVISQRLFYGDEARIVFVGDSTTYGTGSSTQAYAPSEIVGRNLRKYCANIKTYNRGYGSQGTAYWLAGSPSPLTENLSLAPHCWVIRWGTNEGTIGITQFLANIETALTAIRAAYSVDQASIILMMPNAAHSSGYLEFFQRFDSALRRIARQYKCCFVDTTAIFRDGTGTTAWNDAATHPNDIGYTWISSILTDLLVPVTLRNMAEPNVFMPLIERESLNYLGVSGATVTGGPVLGAGEFFAMTWIKQARGNNGGRYIGGASGALELDLAPVGLVTISTVVKSGTAVITSFQYSRLDDGRWHHVGYGRDSSNIARWVMDGAAKDALINYVDASNYTGRQSLLGVGLGTTNPIRASMSRTCYLNYVPTDNEYAVIFQNGGIPPASDIHAGGAGGSAITAGAFVVGKQYRIASVGTTNFTLIGASANTVGLRFIATGVGSGSGTATKTGALFLLGDASRVGVSGTVNDLAGSGATVALSSTACVPNYPAP